MRIKRVVWLPQIVEKIQTKHQVEPIEVEEVFRIVPKFLFWEKGDQKGEDFYLALGKTSGGRFLSVFFVLKSNGDALVVSARDMVAKEKKRYGKK